MILFKKGRNKKTILGHWAEVRGISPHKKYLAPALLRTSCVLLVLTLIASCASKPEKVQQIIIDRIALMPNQPSPYKMTDWYEKAHHFDQYVFNLELKGQYLPFIWIDSAKRNTPQNTFGMFTVIGDSRQAANK